MSSYKSNQTSNDLSEEEDWEDYVPGGYHPVHIGDTFSDGRYVVVRKLGFVDRAFGDT
jgi:serine/threonine-protein kinase SRPK3